MSEDNKKSTKTYGPYSPVRVVDGWAFVSGQIGVEAESKSVSETVEGQTETALKNLEIVLESAGYSKHDVVKTTIFLTDMADFGKLNEVYARFFEDLEDRPARSTVGVKELPRVGGDVSLRVEIDAVAYKETKP